MITISKDVASRFGLPYLRCSEEQSRQLGEAILLADAEHVAVVLTITGDNELLGWKVE